MRHAKIHRCGKHAVNANPRSQIPVWTQCEVHSGRVDVRDRFTSISAVEFSAAEAQRLGQIVRYAMLD